MHFISKQKCLYVSVSTILSCVVNTAMAYDSLVPITTETPEVTLDTLQFSILPSTNSQPWQQQEKISDEVVSQEVLSHRSATLGNALSDELGVHSNPFGGGASAPIIRGQEGPRVKVLQNGTNIVDMSELSPDHAIATDTLLAKQVELLRGASTLLYATSSPAGVINVVDNRIPDAVPTDGIDGKASMRYNTNNQEKTAVVGASVAITPHVVARVEGLRRHADNYHVPSFNLDKPLDYVPDTQNESKVGSLGLAWINDTGSLGMSYQERKDDYGLPGHNHNHDSCFGHVLDDGTLFEKPYLKIYPHLMGNDDVHNTHFHCGRNEKDQKHDHNHPYGHNHDHTLGGPRVNLTSKRYDVRGELNNPIQGIENARLSYATTDYFHDERDGDIPLNLFDNDGKSIRLDIVQQPIGNLTGAFGVQYNDSTSSANIPRLPNCSNNFNDKDKCKKRPADKLTDARRNSGWALVENRNQQTSFFLAEQLKVKDFLFELGYRTEKQKINIDYDVNRLKELYQTNSCGWFEEMMGTCKGVKTDIDKVVLPPELQQAIEPRQERANSYLGSVRWEFLPNYHLEFTASHNERLPTSTELYYHGKHLATNSFEYGNRELTKEISNNYELSFAHQNADLDYQISAYTNDFNNRIFNQTLHKDGNLALNRMTQSKAKYYGLEGKINYQITDTTKIGLFGDMVRGKLTDLPDTYVYDNIFGTKEGFKQADRNAPRVPPMRLGVKASHQLNDNWRVNADLTHAFTQNKVAPLEDVTPSYNLLNVGIDYQKSIGKNDYQLFINGNNLLNDKVYSHTSFLPYVPQMGRNIMVGASMSF